jgi:serine/threonine-protein kinase
MTRSTDTETFFARATEARAQGPAGDTFEEKYDLERILASGGMGVVLLASHRHLGTKVAIKLMHGGAASGRQRFLREAKLAATLDSPYVVRVLDYGVSSDGTPYLVMEYLAGGTLSERLKGRPLSLDEAQRIAREMVEALGEIHGAGIVHRDLKPSNVLLCADEEGIERVKILDFGIAKRMSDDAESAAEPELTSSGEILGTVHYMAPEQIRQSSQVDLRADLWSAGAVLHEMLSGSPPFAGSSRMQVLKAVLAGEPPALGPEVPAWLAAVVRRCLEGDPDRRFASAAEMLAALESDHVQPVHMLPPLVVRPGPWRRHLKLTAVAAALVASALTYGLTDETAAQLSSGIVPTHPIVVAIPPQIESQPSASATPKRPLRPPPAPRRTAPARTAEPRFDDRH